MRPRYARQRYGEVILGLASLLVTNRCLKSEGVNEGAVLVRTLPLCGFEDERRKSGVPGLK